MTDQNVIVQESKPAKQVAITSQDRSGQLMSAIISSAGDPQTDLVKINGMYELYDRVRRDDAAIAYKAAMAITQQKIPAVLKNKTNDHTTSNYADLGAILKAVLPVAGKNGLSMSFREDEISLEGWIRVIGICSHKDGHSEEFPYSLPLDGAGMQGNRNKTPIHAKSSTVSYAERYITCMVFSVPIEDNDGIQSSSPSPKANTTAPQQTEKPQTGVATPKQVGLIKNRLSKAGLSEGELLSKFKLSTLEKMPFKLVNEALDWIEKPSS